MTPKSDIKHRPLEFRRRTDIDRIDRVVAAGEDEFRMAIEAAGLGILDYYPLSGEMHWNNTVREHFGLSPDAPVNYNVFLVGLHSEDRERVHLEMQRSMQPGNDGRLSAEFRTIGIEDGKERVIEASGRSFFNQWGEAVRCIITTREEHAAVRIEEELRTTLESITDGFFACDRDWRFLYVNGVAEAVFGIKRAEVLGRRHWDVFPELVGTRLEQEYRKAANGEVRDFENYYASWDRWFHNRCYPREAGGISVYFEDITERKRAEQRLRESEDRYRILFDKSPLPKWVMDLETFRILEANEAAARHYGYNREEFLHLTIADIRTAEEFEKMVQWVRTCCTKGEKFEGRVWTRHRKKNSEIIEVDVRYTEIVYNGRRAGLGTVIDITEQKRAEEALRESEERFRVAQELSPDGFTILRPVYDDQRSVIDFTWIYENAAVGRMNGTDPEAVVGRRLLDLFPGHAESSFFTIYRQVAETGERRILEAPYQGESIRDRKWFRVAVVPIGKDIAILAQDITERKQTMEELQRSNRELQQFAYVASHDLQEPLRSVASYVELLALRYKGKIDEAADRYISFAIEGANRMSALINDLLAFSRVATRGNVFAPVDIDGVLEQTLRSLRKSIRESGAVITKDTLPHVFADESQLAQLFQNLIANAIKFGKKDVRPQIRISAERKNDEWVFGVHDNGIGIEPRFYERIFTIFQRLHTSDEYPGTGVGLAICRRIVERHGGQIWVESKPGEGSIFYFSIPYREVDYGKTGNRQAG